MCGALAGYVCDSVSGDKQQHVMTGTAVPLHRR